MRVFFPADLQQLHPVDVNFANWVQLAGLRVDHGPESIHLYLRWRLLRKTYCFWRCFVHIVSGDRRLSSLDHDVLSGKPGVTSWEPGDEGYEKVDHWWDRRPENLALHLGLYDPQRNVRCPIVASTLPVRDESSAVVIDPTREPAMDYAIRFPTPPLVPCGMVFRGEMELTAYSAARQDELVWLRLKWTLRGRTRRRLRFFGHAVAEPSATATTLGQFDQAIAVDRRGPATWVEQNVIARLTAPEACWLRAGVCTEPNIVRLRILRGPQPYDPLRSCFFRPLEPVAATSRDR